MKAMTLDMAIQIAADGHEGQVDLHGAPIILHALRVMLAVDPPDQIVAVLHDVCEDTNYTLPDLEAGGLSDRDAETIELLTNEDTNLYSAYIRRLGGNRRARMVKMADLEDNLRTGRRIILLVPRYEKALRLLMEMHNNDKENDNAES